MPRRFAWALHRGAGDSRAHRAARQDELHDRLRLGDRALDLGSKSDLVERGNPRRRAPSTSRSRCQSRKRGRPSTTAIVSKSPSPNCRPRSSASIVACLAIHEQALHPEVPTRGEAARLGARLLEFAHGIGSRHDAGAGAQLDFPVVHGHRADQDIEVETPVLSEVAHGARIRTAAHALQVADQLHTPHLGASGDRPARKQRTEPPARLARCQLTFETMWCTCADSTAMKRHDHRTGLAG